MQQRGEAWLLQHIQHTAGVYSFFATLAQVACIASRKSAFGLFTKPNPFQEVSFSATRSSLGSCSFAKRAEVDTMGSLRQIFGEAIVGLAVVLREGSEAGSFRGYKHGRTSESSKKTQVAQAICPTVSRVILLTRGAFPARQQDLSPCTASRSRENACWAGGAPIKTPSRESGSRSPLG